MTTEIISWISGNILFASDLETMREAVQDAVRQKAFLGGADLRGADLRGANLTGAHLGGADLRRANLTGACLGGATLVEANLTGANLRGADLGEVDLTGANIDYIDWPMSCRSRGMKLDLRLFAQLAAHFCAAICEKPEDAPEIKSAQKALMPLALKSVHAKELGLESTA